MATPRLRMSKDASATLQDVNVPARYVTVPSAPPGPCYNVAQAYGLLAERFRGSQQESILPDFQAAVLRHRTLDAIELAGATGSRH